MQDHYEALGISRSASQLAIKRAYRKLAKECHPDLHPHDPTAESRFKALNDSYRVLEDPDSRWEYDRLLFGVGPKPEPAPTYTSWTVRDFSVEAFERLWFGRELGGAPPDLVGAVVGAVAGVACTLLSRDFGPSSGVFYAFVGGAVGGGLGGSLARSFRDLLGAAATVVFALGVGSAVGGTLAAFLWFWGAIFAWTQTPYPPNEAQTLAASAGVIGAAVGGAIGALFVVLRRRRRAAENVSAE